MAVDHSAVESDAGPGAAPIHPAFVLEQVTVRREDQQVLTGVDLQLTEHRIAVIGLNGSGKSTLVRLLNGLLIPSEGRVTWHGLTTDQQAKQIRRRVGFVFQNPDHQIVMPLVSDDLAFGLKNLGIAKPDLPGRVAQGLARLGLESLADRESHSLSGGEKQLLALAAVLVMQPEVIIFDEPTTMLDLKNKRRLLSIVDGLDQQVIMVSHDLESITDFQRVLLVHEGRVHADGRPAEVIDTYQTLCR